MKIRNLRMQFNLMKVIQKKNMNFQMVPNNIHKNKIAKEI